MSKYKCGREIIWGVGMMQLMLYLRRLQANGLVMEAEVTHVSEDKAVGQPDSGGGGSTHSFWIK